MAELNTFNNFVDLMVKLEQVAKDHGFVLWSDPNRVNTFPIVDANGGNTPAQIIILLPESYAAKFHPKFYKEPVQVREFLDSIGE